MSSSIALLISTYDASEDLWFPLEQTYQKFWANIEFPVYLTSNHKEFESNLFTSLKIGDELSWSDNLIKSLNIIEEDYVLLTFDDLFLKSEIDNSQIKELMHYAIVHDFNYLQFYRSISLGKRINQTLFKKAKNSKYKNSTIWSFWKKEVLLKLLDKNETAWEFEVEGNNRAADLDNFYSTRSNIIPFVNGVVKGKWNLLAKRRLLAEGVKINKERQSLTLLQALGYHFRDLQFDLLTYIIHKIY